MKPFVTLVIPLVNSNAVYSSGLNMPGLAFKIFAYTIIALLLILLVIIIIAGNALEPAM